MKITLLHPSRSRPAKSFACISEWRAKAGTDVEVILSLDSDDPKLDAYYAAYDKSDTTILVQKNRSAVDAVNKAASIATGDIFIVVSDDFECPKDWVSKVTNIVKGKRDFVLKTYDGVQNYIVTLPILDKVYYNRFGYIYHPAYRHMFVDTEFTHVADILRRLIIRNDLTFSHKHHSVTKDKNLDDVTRRAEATWNEGKKLYLDRCNAGFDLGHNVDIMTLSPESLHHIQWLKKHGF